MCHGSLFFSSFTLTMKITGGYAGRRSGSAGIVLSDGRRHLSAVFITDDRCRAELPLPLAVLPPKHFTGSLMLVFFGKSCCAEALFNGLQRANEFHIVLLKVEDWLLVQLDSFH
jgi:hypothetical protein